MTGPHVVSLGDITPQVADGAFVAATAALIGSIEVRADASVFYGAVLRAEVERIVVGAGSNIQDNCTLHVDVGFPLQIGRDVSVGHGAVLHGCTIGDGCLIGMNAVVLNGATVGDGSLVAAGSVVLEGTVIPPKSLVAGVPAKVRRPLTDDEVERCRMNAAQYVRLAELHRAATG